jgi:hypothetical protein
VTVFVKAVDTSGNESVNAAVLRSGLVPGAPRNVLITEQFDPDWDSADIIFFDGEVIGGKLYAPFSTTDLFWTGEDTDLFWTGDDGDPFWDFAYDPAIVVALYEAPTGSGGSRLWVQSTLEDMAGLGVLYAVNPNMESIVIPDDLALMPETLLVIEGATYLFAMRGTPALAGDPRPAIAELSIVIDVPDIVERFEDVEIPGGSASSGVRLPIEATYNKIMGVGGLTLQDTSTGAIMLEVIDKGTPSAENPTDGPLIKAKDVSGSYVGATFDAEVWGY